MSDLIPADKSRCQVNRYDPFIMGGKVHSRCSNKPGWVIRETVPAGDGQMGEQSVCSECRQRWEKSTGIEGINETWVWEPLP